MERAEARKILIEYVKACREDDMPTLEKFEYEEILEAMSMGAASLSTLEPSEELKGEIREWVNLMVGASFPEQDGDYISEEDYRSVIRQTALHFYSLGQQAKKDLPEWKKAYAGTHFGEDVVTISPKGKDFPRVVETALTDCLYIPISELMKLAKKEE